MSSQNIVHSVQSACDDNMDKDPQTVSSVVIPVVNAEPSRTKDGALSTHGKMIMFNTKEGDRSLETGMKSEQLGPPVPSSLQQKHKSEQLQLGTRVWKSLQQTNKSQELDVRASNSFQQPKPGKLICIIDNRGMGIPNSGKQNKFILAKQVQDELDRLDLPYFVMVDIHSKQGNDGSFPRAVCESFQNRVTRQNLPCAVDDHHNFRLAVVDFIEQMDKTEQKKPLSDRNGLFRTLKAVVVEGHKSQFVLQGPDNAIFHSWLHHMRQRDAICEDMFITCTAWFLGRDIWLTSCAQTPDTPWNKIGFDPNNPMLHSPEHLAIKIGCLPGGHFQVLHPRASIHLHPLPSKSSSSSDGPVSLNQQPSEIQNMQKVEPLQTATPNRRYHMVPLIKVEQTNKIETSGLTATEIQTAEVSEKASPSTSSRFTCDDQGAAQTEHFKIQVVHPRTAIDPAALVSSGVRANAGPDIHDIVETYCERCHMRFETNSALLHHLGEVPECKSVYGIKYRKLKDAERIAKRKHCLEYNCDDEDCARTKNPKSCGNSHRIIVKKPFLTS